MKLKKNCIFFNAGIPEAGGTPDWEHTLGQGQPLYLLKEPGCSEIINGLAYNFYNPEPFHYGSGGNNYNIEIVSIFKNVKIKIYDSEEKKESLHELTNPLIIILVKQISGTHNGRRLLKMSNGFIYESIKNEDFYLEINNLVPNPWFGYSMNYDNTETGVLTITIIKAPILNPVPSNNNIRYLDKEIRKSTWDMIANEYSLLFEQSENQSTPQNTNQPEVIIQKIFYGAPGTGKSHKVNEIIKGKENKIERVTFHPEYDYNTFVGGYKPTMNGDNIRYEFVPQSFTKIYCAAWNSLALGKEEDFYLIIEEINRGNCAEIFGDIFLLLDRNSDYDISPSKEIKDFLSNNENGLLSIEFGLNGGKMKLPSNLNILATMNTSDQSLFPMDSAFKRRWDWEYIPINYEESENNLSSKFKVKLTETETFSWLLFIKSVNFVIKQNENLGMDKCIGNYFIKPVSDEIDIATFINKAIFYLWNDVFKDEIDENNIFINQTSYEDFFPIETNGIIKVKEILDKLNVNYN